MNVHTDITSLPYFRNAVVTIGTFDGVHLGHRQIIYQLIEEAKKVNGETVIITFHPHPRKIVNPTATIHLITTLDEKTTLLEQLGIDHLVVVPFIAEFANLSAAGYIEDFLLKYFNPHTLIIGYDHRFGKGRKGDFHLMEHYSKSAGFYLYEIPQHLLHESAISSTRIREDLLKGNIEKANELLGYTYNFQGAVITGNRLGRTIGYPTANIEISDKDKIIPGKGVYAVRFEIKDAAHNSMIFSGMMNIGTRPTIDGTKVVIEVNVFDFDEDIYGKHVTATVCNYLRAEKKFNGLDELKGQLATDKERAVQLLR